MELSTTQKICAGAGFLVGFLIALLLVGARSFFLLPVCTMIFGGGLGVAGAYLGKQLEG